ncbi:single-stranded DNA-binding protein [Aphanothece hegewaldii]|nr:single-stranded DNA-binding protein [Aphanothece hegewaldii]
MNSIVLAGRLGQNPQTQYFSSGACLTKCSLAVQKSKDEVSWFDLEVWGKPAEILANYTSKGSVIGVEGTLKIDIWKDKENNYREKPVIKVSKVQLLSSNKKDAETEEE